MRSCTASTFGQIIEDVDKEKAVNQEDSVVETERTAN